MRPARLPSAEPAPREPAARPAHAAFRRWCLGHSGCSGGDPGSAAHPSVWVCGIEPGGPDSTDPRTLAAMVRSTDVSGPSPGYAHWSENLAHSFTRRITKLLSALEGGHACDYRRFAEQRQPFTRGARGYCRLNLYPLGFADTDRRRWSESFARATGFAGKPDYLTWCDAHRLPRMRAWARACTPRLIVGLGKSYRARFHAAFMDPDGAFREEEIHGKQLSWGRNEDGTLVAVLPFLTSASGLQSDAAIDAFGARLRAILGT